MRIFSITLSFLFISFSASAEPLNFAGVDFGMSIDDQLSAVEGKGYQCQKVGVAHMCNNGKEQIFLSKDMAQFSCGTYGGCDFLIEEL